MKESKIRQSALVRAGFCVASIGAFNLACLASSIETDVQFTLTASASRPALSNSPIIAGSSAFAFASVMSAGGVYSMVDTQELTGGGASAGAVAYTSGCWSYVGGAGFASMLGGVGEWPVFQTLYTLSDLSQLQMNTDPCMYIGFGTASGNLNYSSFPGGTVIVYGVEFNSFTSIQSKSQASGAVHRRDYQSGSRRQRYAVLEDSAVIGMFQRIDDKVTASPGWSTPVSSYDPYNGETTVTSESDPVTPTIGGGGGLNISIRIVHADENALDLNGDGRFDEADATWLAGEIPSTDPALLTLVNLVTCPPCPPEEEPCECTEVIDGDDLAALEALLGYGLGSIKFGDRDGDGCVTCADAIHGVVDVDPQFDDVGTGSSLYNMGLDANGDGILDATDRAAFYALVNHADFNNDGFVDDADFLIFASYYNTLDTAEGDQNGDNITDDADYVIFTARYNELVCPSCE
ncbi:MAG: hypothetical protein KF691_09750 [Phycisphaeraceae bacterium]|nr:hypothetical protein [Phycisphaeraceae bacterium]